MKAVNKAGESKPAEVTTPVKTGKKQRKPKIDARHWNDIVKKIGQNFELECKYTGVPEPSITWERIDDVSTRRPKIYFPLLKKETILYIVKLMNYLTFYYLGTHEISRSS